MFVAEHRDRFGVEPICRALEVSASAYYERRGGRRSARRVEDERLLAEIRKLAGAATRVIDARGAMVVPGFTDAHVHFIDGGFALQSVKLRDAKTKAEFIRRIGAFAKAVPSGAWAVRRPSSRGPSHR